MQLKPTIYIVDDDELVLATLQNVFSFAGFQVHTFSSASSFLLASLESDCCLILDLHMPDINGLELQQHLKSQDIAVPVIIYSGNADVTSTVKAMTNGAYTLIQKPVSNEVLIQKVEQAIKQHNAKQKNSALCKDAIKKLSLLSERERDVAYLAAEGLSATMIAEKLFISPRTAEAHKASIFNKLEIKSVASLAQLVLLSTLKDDSVQP